MNNNTSVIRFLMFMILALIIFFNLSPLSESGADDESETDNETSKIEEYCLVDGETSGEKICKKISSEDNCQNRFDEKKECNEWKDALINNGSEYTTDDIDKLTIMSSDDMIFCLKNDKSCEELKFGDCHDIHIGTYITEDNCNDAKDQMENDSDEDSYAKQYCLIGDICKEENDDNDCGSSTKYCNMNKCKTENSITDADQDSGEYCLTNNECVKMGCGDVCNDGFYTSKTTCESKTTT